jgi:hypothetical protein
MNYKAMVIYMLAVPLLLALAYFTFRAAVIVIYLQSIGGSLT